MLVYAIARSTIDVDGTLNGFVSTKSIYALNSERLELADSIAFTQSSVTDIDGKATIDAVFNGLSGDQGLFKYKN